MLFVCFFRFLIKFVNMILYPNVKINVGLKVLRRHPDGYHDLEALFVPYPGIADCLEIITGDDYSRTLAGLKEHYSSLTQAISDDGKLMITLARREGVDWDPLKDLTAKAYFLLAEDFDLPPMKIYLEKLSPVGAGLGGGSSDAAFALRMMATLANLDLTDEQLASYAARLGSDCAFFVYNTPMFGTGRGEILEPFPLDLKGYRIEVVIPEGIAVSTADAYRGIVPCESGTPLKEILHRPVTSWKDSLENDFEKTVFAKYPALAAVKEGLYEKGALYAAMSGSGSACFGIFCC